MEAKHLIGFVLLISLGLFIAGCSSEPESVPAASEETPNVVASPDSEEAPDLGTVASTPEPGDATTPAPTDTPEAPDLGTVTTPQPESPQPPLDVEVDIEVGIDLGPEDIFSGAGAALDTLSSYRFATTFLFTGEEDGDKESGSIELSGAIMDNDREHFVWKNLEDGDHFELIKLESETWMYSDGEWEKVPAMVADAMSQAVLVFAPSVVWGGVFGAVESDPAYVGPETIDGILAHHYTATYQRWGGYWSGELVDATGDVWIADAGYPLRYDFSATGVDENGDRGSISWTMEITDVNQDIEITPPPLSDETF